jgi:hypothetical protein
MKGRSESQSGLLGHHPLPDYLLFFPSPWYSTPLTMAMKPPHREEAMSLRNSDVEGWTRESRKRTAAASTREVEGGE